MARRSRIRGALLSLCIIVAVATVQLIRSHRRRVPILMPRRVVRVDKRAGGALSAAGDAAVVECRVPPLLLDDAQLAHHFHAVPPLRCSSSDEHNWVFVGDRRTFEIEPAAVERHGRIRCSYEHFWRVDDAEVATRRYENYPSGSPLLGDFFRADCTAADGQTFANVFATVAPSSAAVERARTAKTRADGPRLDVYHLGFDSVSRMTFQRKMKLTYKFITEELHAVVLKGYNIVGDGTPQAFIPILTGKTEEELPLTRKRFADANFIDVYPFIWKEFEKSGYVTMFGEDMAKEGMFAYRLKGFDKQPTDHYMQTFFVEAEKDFRWWRDKRCLANEPQHAAFLRYAEHFFTSYPADVAKFAVHFHGRLSHDDINMIEVADADTVAHLRRLRDVGQLNRTLFIMMADHGHRFADIRSTQQGMLEERLPMYAIAAPRWWRDGPGRDAWANLRLNADRLTSPFDMHATLQRVLHWRAPGRGDASQRSIALWDEVPVERSCAQAGIADHWCACLQWARVPAELDELTTTLARSVVLLINDETQRERSLCAPLQLAAVESSRVLAPKHDALSFKKTLDSDGFVADLSADTQLVSATFQLRFRTAPGDALYEATLPYDIRVADVHVDLDAVSHINRYGDKPHCVIDKDYFLAKWCVCYDRV